MFIKPRPFRGPPGSIENFEVRGPKGLKPFPTRVAAESYAKELRDLPNGWAEIAQVVRIIVEKRR